MTLRFLSFALLLILSFSSVLAASSLSDDASDFNTTKHSFKPENNPLARNAGSTPSYNWDSVIASSTDPDFTAIFQVLNTLGAPSATIAVQLNPDPTTVLQTSPTVWRNPQYWWAAGYGMDYRAPFRVASNSKPLTHGIWSSMHLALCRLNFYSLWVQNIGPLPEPLDTRVHSITVQQLLDHVSGFDNGQIGYDPAFQCESVDTQLPTILVNSMLATPPGSTYSYSNFGYMILARLAEGLSGVSYISQVRALFPNPTTVPIYEANDYVAVSSASSPPAPASEPSTYYINNPDGEFCVWPMKGNGDIVANAVTLSWYATQYWLLGDATIGGKKFTSKPAIPGYTWIMDGSFPGTYSSVVQWITPGGQAASIAVLVNTRNDAKYANFLADLNNAGLALLQHKFSGF